MDTSILYSFDLLDGGDVEIFTEKKDYVVKLIDGVISDNGEILLEGRFPSYKVEIQINTNYIVARNDYYEIRFHHSVIMSDEIVFGRRNIVFRAIDIDPNFSQEIIPIISVDQLD